ncbi:hypothetical protein DPMN_073554 [Dreissena polymorpha]|uniref:Uncharacterized protein n=1 Tax=Dreissena polymorpha TaxID=45954 RepID=A0A9D4BZF6_DREPO|nr:hypothetical protein DPMN_073554 [Dreissena polymorpha]
MFFGVLKYYNDQYDPGLISIRELLELLINVIENAPAQIKKLANTAIVEVATCIIDKARCARIKQEEVKVILDSLTSPCTASRVSALQVR